jgi:hypothetical protein
MRTANSPLTLSQTRVLAAVIKTTRAMLAAAKAESWETVIELEALRREDLKRCFAIPLEDDSGDLLAEALAVLLHLNEELMGLLKCARDQAPAENGREVRDLEAAGEYQSMQLVR